MNDEKHIHHPALLNEPAFHPVEPEDVLVAAFLRVTRREQAAGVISCRFDVSSAAGKGPHISFLSDQADWPCEVGPHRTRQRYQTVARRGPHLQRFINSEVDGANVERASLALWRPFAVQPDELRDAVEKQRRRHFRHYQSSRRPIEPGMIVARSKQGNPAVKGAMGPETFEDHLSIMKSAWRRRQWQRAIGNDLRLSPMTVLVIGNQHVVAEDSPELSSLQRCLGQAG